MISKSATSSLTIIAGRTFLLMESVTQPASSWVFPGRHVSVFCWEPVVWRRVTRATKAAGILAHGRSGLTATAMSELNSRGTLYIVATPIGNLEDITHRAVRILRQADLIACEDTRQTRKLLDHYGISNPTTSYHEHNEAGRAEELLRKLGEGQNIALVSDAGMPGISDPGYRVIKLAIERGVTVIPIPGASAITAALVGSGLPTDAFEFRGFLPARSGQRRTALEALLQAKHTVVLYEAPTAFARLWKMLPRFSETNAPSSSPANSLSCMKNLFAARLHRFLSISKNMNQKGKSRFSSDPRRNTRPSPREKRLRIACRKSWSNKRSTRRRL